MYKGVGRSRRAEKPQRAEFGPDHAAASASAAASYRGEGHVQFSGRINASRTTFESAYKTVSSVEENSFSLEIRQSSSERANRKPIQTLITEEASKDMKSRHHSPSVVAKLMGLDTVPPPLPQIAHKQRKNLDTCLRSASSVGFPTFAQSKENSCQKNTTEDQDFKDIFEVMENNRQKKQPTWKRLQNTRRSEVDLNFIRQKFMDVKRLSSDAALQNSKEFDDALEILHSNKDIFLKILQDRNTLFDNHHEDMNHEQVASRRSQITVLKSSKGDKHRNAVRAKSERKYESYSPLNKEIPCSIRKPASPLINCNTPKEHRSFVPLNSSSSVHKGKTEVQPTRIVVLKPSLEKTQKMFAPIPFLHDNIHFESRKHSESVATAIREIYKEGRERQKFSESVAHFGYKAMGSKEIARNIARQRHTRGSHSKSTIISQLNSYAGKAGLYTSSDVFRHSSSELYLRYPNQLDVWTDSSRPSYSFSNESSVSTEARKRMSERWKLTHQFQDVGNAARGVSTLGEMLALSDKEPKDANVISLGMKKISDYKFTGKEVLGTFSFSSGNRSRQGRENGSSMKLRRSKSLPAASTAHQSAKFSCTKQGAGGRCYMLKDVLNMSPDDFLETSYGKQQKFLAKSSCYNSNKHHRSLSVGEENKLPELEVHVNSEELRKSIHVRILSEENVLHPAVLYDEAIAGRKHLIELPLLPICESKTSNLTIPDENLKPFSVQLTPGREELSIHNDHNNVNKDDWSPQPQVDHLSQSEVPEAGLALRPKECEQPSPVSVLEPPSEEESSCSGCFEKISADLQELRMQLNLLKLESTERHEEEIDITELSDEDSAADSQSVLPTRGELLSFRDDDDREFSYLLDILTESGIHSANQDRFSTACSSLNPVCSDVFEELEKKYGVMESWFRSERKLLFDHINSILIGTVAPSLDLSPWISSVQTRKDEDFVERLWQMMVKQRKELDCRLEEMILDPRWLVVEDDIKVIVKEIERMLNEDILNEVFANFISGFGVAGALFQPAITANRIDYQVTNAPMLFGLEGEFGVGLFH